MIHKSSTNVQKIIWYILEHFKNKHAITRRMMEKTWLPKLEEYSGSSKKFMWQLLDGKYDNIID